MFLRKGDASRMARGRILAENSLAAVGGVVVLG